MKRKSKKKKQKTLKKIVIVIVLLVIIAKIISVAPNYIKEQDSNGIKVIMNNEDVTLKLNKEVIIDGEVVYLSKSDVKKFLDNTLYQEENSIITTSRKTSCNYRKK